MKQMQLTKIYQKKHELWLKILFASFAISNEKIKSELNDMAGIEFRHLKWISNRLKSENISYDYEKNKIDIQKASNFELFRYLASEMKELKSEYKTGDALFERISSDEEYFLTRLEYFLSKDEFNGEVTAFNRQRVYEDIKLSKTSTDALTIFLFEESYKEYELILIYAYMQNYTDDIKLYNVYQDLIYESIFHLKCFGQMQAKMGILAIPRTIIESLYKRSNIKKFLTDGIEEEKVAKQECIKLSSAVNNEELSKFFDFINYQENYHMVLMQKALEVL